jgi:meso-butanediol dehydrogenase / (S,S)-butanediol dehydrogenase / diacetyl reductase
MRLEGSVTIVTGAGSGIGAATARRLAAEGARVIANDADGAAVDDVAASLPGDGHRTVPGDVSREETAEALARTARDAHGRIDVLVNNAGVHFIRDITDTSAEEWDQVVATNLKSMFLCSRAVIPTMVEQQSGSIINLGSISSFIGQEFGGPSTYLYNVTKAGALQLAVSLATRYAADGIRVNAVCPGATRTQQIRHALPDLPPEEEEQVWQFAGKELTPLGRVGRPEEIAAAICFLASDESSFVTGAPLIVDGGYLAR